MASAVRTKERMNFDCMDLGRGRSTRRSAFERACITSDDQIRINPRMSVAAGSKRGKGGRSPAPQLGTNDPLLTMYIDS